MLPWKVTIIAAVGLNGSIGNGKEMPWHIPEDLKHFKDTTRGHIVVMGRKTFQSIGSRPLPGRINIVVSSEHLINGRTPIGFPDEPTKLIEYNSLELALNAAYGLQTEERKVFVIGGGEIYRQALRLTDELIISHVHQATNGETDVFFPPIDPEQFETVKIESQLRATVPFTIVTYKRRKR